MLLVLLVLVLVLLMVMVMLLRQALRSVRRHCSRRAACYERHPVTCRAARDEQREHTCMVRGGEIGDFGPTQAPPQPLVGIQAAKALLLGAEGSPRKRAGL